MRDVGKPIYTPLVAVASVVFIVIGYAVPFVKGPCDAVS